VTVLEAWAHSDYHRSRPRARMWFACSKRSASQDWWDLIGFGFALEFIEAIHPAVLDIESSLHIVGNFGRVVSTRRPQLEVSAVHLIERGLAVVSERDGDRSNLVSLAVYSGPFILRINDLHRFSSQKPSTCSSQHPVPWNTTAASAEPVIPRHAAIAEFLAPSRDAKPFFPRRTGTLARRGMTCRRSLVVRGLCGVFGPPCRGISEADHDGKPAHAVEVLVVAGPHAGTEGTVNWCDEHGKMFYAQQENEYLN
jgi:hypothetical protein